MASKGLAWDLKMKITSPVLEEEPMRQHTRGRIGGPAQVMVDLCSKEDLQQIIQYSRERHVPLTVIGAGTNLLVRDGGIRGIVVKLGAGMSSLNVQDGVITAGAGVRLGHFSAVACTEGIGGFEFLAGIPGTVGGAVVMNAGANDSSVSKVVEEVVLIDRDGNIFKRKASELGFNYRKSNLLNSEYIVVEAVFRGENRLPEIIREKINGFLARRKATQPYDLPNAGSVFKNPPGDSAGRLIESAGCKGLQTGGAQVSLKHANFIVNLGEATAVDVIRLINIVRDRVYEMSGIQLVTEVQILGDD